MQRMAIVVGGSNGIGMAVARKLLLGGRRVVIFDKARPSFPLPEDSLFVPCDLSQFDQSIFAPFVGDAMTDMLVITAGIGRVAPLEQLHLAELERVMRVNALGTMQLLRLFYNRLLDSSAFYCAVMGSISGWVSSPLFCAYAASKAAVCRFVESANIELEAAGSGNRILDVSPGSIAGTRFNGGENRPQLTEELAAQIVARMEGRETLFIPDYEQTYRSVIRRYQENPHQFGLESYQYKLASGRMGSARATRVGYMSGTWDLFHIGHLNILRRAREQCDYLIVGVHPDASHKGKKTFISYEERVQIVGAVRYVDQVVPAQSEDCDAWPLYHFDALFVGSDYQGSARFQRYEDYFADKQVQIIFFPYTSGTSSTQIRQVIQRSIDGQ